ncbi:YfiR family protein [Thiocystis violacea]|uniref:YfiR family protein n=1 Tax=Thiocystis violacea TaxID=13725 RepID=UPI0019047A58|nr:YfiR family protein [Thiocystis violacea]MBK1716137.1 hypothetical protein [Thiocystis violacea]
MRDRFESGRHGIRRILVTALALMCTAPAPRADVRDVREAEVVIAYLYNFSKFVTWPTTTFPSADTSLNLCVYGRTSSADAFKTLDAKSAQGHPVRVEPRSRGDTLHGCHIVYASESEQAYLTPLLRAVDRRPVLTVSEIPGFVAAGGMIGFVRADNRLRFEINTTSAEAAGLTISSQLLRLAIHVLRD